MRTGALRSWRRNKVMRQEFRQKTGDWPTDNTCGSQLEFNLILCVVNYDQIPIIMETNMDNWATIKKILID